MENILLTTKQAAKYLGMSEAFLERDRWAGARIPFVRMGARAVRYEFSALQAYVKSNKLDRLYYVSALKYGSPKGNRAPVSGVACPLWVAIEVIQLFLLN